MFLARKARMGKFTSVGYGQNEDHPDLEHFNEESSEESSEEDSMGIRHDVRIEAYDNLDQIRYSKYKFSV